MEYSINDNICIKYFSKERYNHHVGIVQYSGQTIAKIYVPMTVINVSVVTLLISHDMFLQHIGDIKSVINFMITNMYASPIINLSVCGYPEDVSCLLKYMTNMSYVQDPRINTDNSCISCRIV